MNEKICEYICSLRSSDDEDGHHLKPSASTTKHILLKVTEVVNTKRLQALQLYVIVNREDRMQLTLFKKFFRKYDVSVLTS